MAANSGIDLLTAMELVRIANRGPWVGRPIFQRRVDGQADRKYRDRAGDRPQSAKYQESRPCAQGVEKPLITVMGVVASSPRRPESAVGRSPVHSAHPLLVTLFTGTEYLS